MTPTPKELQEHNKYYEKVVEHLISEGFTDDREGAKSIINGMSETWYSLIVKN